MSKKFNDQVMKFEITEQKLKMEITLKDLKWLFENSPENTYDGENPACKVKPGKRKEFAERIVNFLMDENADNGNDTNWGHVFENAFTEFFEGAGDEVCNYYGQD